MVVNPTQCYHCASLIDRQLIDHDSISTLKTQLLGSKCILKVMYAIPPTISLISMTWLLCCVVKFILVH